MKQEMNVWNGWERGKVKSGQQMKQKHIDKNDDALLR